MAQGDSLGFSRKIVDAIFDMGQVLEGVEEEGPPGEASRAGLEVISITSSIIVNQVLVFSFQEVHLYEY